MDGLFVGLSACLFVGVFFWFACLACSCVVPFGCLLFVAALFDLFGGLVFVCLFVCLFGLVGSSCVFGSVAFHR